MLKLDAHRYPPSPDPKDPVHLAAFADDSAYRMVDGQIVEQSKHMAQRGEGMFVAAPAPCPRDVKGPDMSKSGTLKSCNVWRKNRLGISAGACI
jgi:hypothetical protein